MTSIIDDMTDRVRHMNAMQAAATLASMEAERASIRDRKLPYMTVLGWIREELEGSREFREAFGSGPLLICPGDGDVGPCLSTGLALAGRPTCDRAERNHMEISLELETYLSGAVATVTLVTRGATRHVRMTVVEPGLLVPQFRQVVAAHMAALPPGDGGMGPR